MYAHPGKFEGELALAPLAYEASLNGCSEEYDFGRKEYDFGGEEYDLGGEEYNFDHYTVCQGPLKLTDEEIAEHELTAEDVEFANNLLGFIVHEDNYGFVSVSWYEKGEEVQMAATVSKLDNTMAALWP